MIAMQPSAGVVLGASADRAGPLLKWRDAAPTSRVSTPWAARAYRAG